MNYKREGSSLVNQDQKRDRYLQKRYGVTLERYNQELALNGGGCAICESKPLTRSLPADHDHTVSNGKIKAVKDKDGWTVAFDTPYLGYICTSFKNKRDAVKFAKRFLKEKSFRGIICMNCNRGLQRFRDKPELLESAAKYLRSYKERLHGGQ